MENEEQGSEKKINEDLVTFMRRRSQSELPRYTASLLNHLKLQNRRVAAAKRQSDHERTKGDARKQGDGKEGDAAGRDHQESAVSGHAVRRRGRDCGHRSGARSGSRSVSGEPEDQCGRRRRRRRRRRRSCRRRRRRSRRRRRRSGCRRRRRSRSRRRRRRSCRRRRRRSRRRRRRRC